jgi:hypothetical protein
VVLDILYRWMYGAGIYLNEFEMIQKAPDEVEVIVGAQEESTKAKVKDSLGLLQDLLVGCIGHSMKVELTMFDMLPRQAGKRRVIKRAFRS